MKARREVKREHLAELLLFEGCSADELDRVARSADEVAVPEGYVLVYEGDWGSDVFVVVDGTAVVTAGGRELAEMGPGAVIGELAALNPAPRTATVVAATPMRFFVFDADAFDGLLDEVPLVARRLMSGLASRYQAVAADTLDPLRPRTS